MTMIMMVVKIIQIMELGAELLINQTTKSQLPVCPTSQDQDPNNLSFRPVRPSFRQNVRNLHIIQLVFCVSPRQADKSVGSALFFSNLFPRNFTGLLFNVEDVEALTLQRFKRKGGKICNKTLHLHGTPNTNRVKR